MSNDIEKLLSEFRAGLEGVTPGPWIIKYDDVDDDHYIEADYRPNPLTRYVVSVAYEMRDRDMRHIARCSPENISALLDALEAERSARVRLEEALRDGPNEIEIDRLRLAAFKTNSNEDKAAYYLAVSKWFQDRHYRALSHSSSKGESRE